MNGKSKVAVVCQAAVSWAGVDGQHKKTGSCVPASDSESRMMLQSADEQFESKQIGTIGEPNCTDENKT